jgi:ABC-type glycerol-3-phosphate transport system permease component
MASISIRRQQQLTKGVGYVGLLAIIIIIGAPMYWMVAGSLKTLPESQQFPPKWIPTSWHWENYREAWNAVPIGRFYINSIVITVLGAGLQLFNGILCAYAFAFLKFPAKKWLFLFVLGALMVPTEVVILPNYIFFGSTVKNWFDLSGNWLNTYQAIVLPGAATAFGTFLLRQGFLGLPKDVLDAAKVDGAGHLRTMFGIVLPMSKPIVVTFALISMVNKWNDYLWPLVSTTKLEWRPITVGIRLLLQEEGTQNWGVVMAGACFVVLPIIAIYIFAQRFIIEGLTAGATKG